MTTILVRKVNDHCHPDGDAFFRGRSTARPARVPGAMHRRLLLPVLGSALLLLAAPAPAAPVVRGQHKLDRALRAALSRLHEREHAAPVLVVVDATPYTRAAAIAIGEALHALSQGRPVPASEWRLARLGERAGDAEPAAAALSAGLQRLLAEPQREVSTLAALRRTLRTFSARDGLVVYLADWHFEDDEGLEKLVRRLKRRGQTLSVVGSEAAFGRGWNDGFDAFGREAHRDRIGRDPFRGTRARPWHGGETAYPHVPWRFGGAGWETAFPRAPGLPGLRALLGGAKAKDADDARWPEDVRERLRALDAGRPRTLLRYPLPSSFGPYALMRAAEETGGRYVLWSWNAGGRVAVRYDYARCDRFAPDLRARGAILRDVRRRPLARALAQAWHALADDGVARITPPLAPGLGSSREIAEASASPLPLAWPTRAQHGEFVRRAAKMREAAERARALLDRAIDDAGEPDDAVDRRYLADAHLIAHVARVQAFSLGEALAAAKDLPDDAFDADDTHPGLRPVVWIPETPPGRAPAARNVPIHDDEAGAAVLAQRRDHRARYRRTPFGELVRRNAVHTYELTRYRTIEPPRGGLSGTPSFSDRDDAPSPPTPPGGGSGGGGPTSGG